MSRPLWIPGAKIVSPSMKTSGVYANGWPLGAVVHFTAGRDNAEDAVVYGRGQGYAYLCIQGDGQLVQAHPVNRWGSHAGKSYHEVLGSGVSSKLIGIEITSAGRLEKRGDKFISWFGKEYGPTEVRYIPRDRDNVQAGYYHKYTKLQESKLMEVLLWLHANGGGIFKPDFVLGHDEVSPGRKNDPGGALSQTMPEFRSFLKQMTKAH